jgi:hypothetical protein
MGTTVKEDHSADLERHVASLVDALRIASTAEWDTSEPYFCGGLGSAGGNTYSCRSPFQGDCEFSVDIATGGGTAAQILVASARRTSGVDFTGALVPGYNDGMQDALVINVPVNTTIPVDSQWYQIRNSENTVYVLVICATNAAGVNLQFRQKRK